MPNTAPHIICNRTKGFFQMHALEIIVSLGFGLACACGSRIVYKGLWKTSADNYLAPVGVETVGIFIVVTCVFWILLQFAAWILTRCKAHARQGSERQNLGLKQAMLFLLKCAAILLVLWCPYMLALYPGVALPDSLSSLAQAHGEVPLSNHHPVAFTALIGLFFNASTTNANHAVFAFAVVQSLVLALTLSAGLLYLKYRKVRRPVLVVFLLFFGLCPVFPIYGMQIQKDTLFSCFCTLLALVLALACQKRNGSNASLFEKAALVATLLLVWYFKGSGPVVALVSLGVFVIVSLVRRQWKQCLQVALPVLMASFLIINPLIATFSKPAAAAESLGVPLQQLACMVVKGGSLSPEDKEFLFTLLPEEQYQTYTPCSVDTLKWNVYFNNKFLNANKQEFLLVWARNLLPNAVLYTDAYVLETFGYWVPGAKDAYGFLDTRVQHKSSPNAAKFNEDNPKESGTITAPNIYGITRVDLFERITGLSLASDVLSSMTFLGSGTLLWLTLFVLCLAARTGRGSKKDTSGKQTYESQNKHKQERLVVFVPALTVVGTVLLAAPVAFSLRYVFVLVLCLPLFIGLLFAEPPAEPISPKPTSEN